jgi:hypothetical protein
VIHEFLQYVAERPSSIALHESLYLWPAIESVHVLTLALFVGFAAMLDLRLIGVAFMHMSVSRLGKQLLPWTMGAFAAMVLSGLAVFYANPVHFYHNIFFRVKFAMLILAGVNAWIFHAGIWLKLDQWDTAEKTPRPARVAGAASLLLWAAIITSGRLIAYNWFECGAGGPAVIQFVSGCDSGEAK